MRTGYSKAVLLAHVDVIHLIADTLDEVAQLFETAAKKYIPKPGTDTIRRTASEARKRFDYFWLIYNDAPLYDRWLFAIHHVSDEELDAHGGAAGVPTEAVSFHQGIYSHFVHALEDGVTSAAARMPALSLGTRLPERIRGLSRGAVLGSPVPESFERTPIAEMRLPVVQSSVVVHAETQQRLRP